MTFYHLGLPIATVCSHFFNSLSCVNAICGKLMDDIGYIVI